MRATNKSRLDRALALLNAVARVPASWREDAVANPVEARTRRELVEVAHGLAAKQLTWGATGVISARVGARDGVISKSGVALGALTPQDFARQDLRASSASQGVASDWLMHRAIYLAQPAAHAVARLQPPFTTVLSCRDNVSPLPVPEVFEFWSTVTWVAFDAPGDESVIERVTDAAKKSQLILLKRGGLLCWSNAVSELTSLAQTLEHVAQMLWLNT
jgi:ribulose-5-phosphate 4-epimerase/fuculose-1-phosphate aldolase